MGRYELCVKDFEATCVQAMDKIGERDFRTVGVRGKHAFAKETCAQSHAVDAAKHLVFAPNLK